MNTRFKSKYSIKSGDTVVVIAGDDKNLTTPRKVVKVLLDKQRVVVEGVNIMTKHMKPTSETTQGSIIKVEAPIHISNVMLWDAKAKKGTKVKNTRVNGKLVRVSKKSQEVIK